VNSSNAYGNILDQSKATPAFKKGLKDQFQLNSNATSNTLTSNDGRFSDSNYNLKGRASKNLLTDTQKTDKLLSDIQEINEDESIGRKTLDSRQLIKKQPKSYELFKILDSDFGKRCLS